jgi:hypothetical protein
MRNKTISRYIAILGFFVVSLPGNSQELFAKYLSKDHFTPRFEKLRDKYGINKIIPQEIELECLTALSYYPELKNIKIIFQFGSPLSTMVSRPKLKSIFRSGNKREYEVIVRKPGTSKNGLEWNELSFNSLIGWIAHELGHIVHYNHKTSGGVLFTGIKYAFPRYRRRMERFTDNLVIQHDLGYALLEGTDYCINHSDAKPHYKKYLEKYYLSPMEIREAINDKCFYKIAYNKTKLIRQDHISNLK